MFLQRGVSNHSTKELLERLLGLDALVLIIVALS